MLNASKLRGISVVDLDAAQNVGQIVDVVLDPPTRRLAGLLIARGHNSGGSLLGGAPRGEFFPAAGLHAIGPDVVTARHTDPGQQPEVDPLAPFVRLSEMVGRRVVTHSGRVLGPIEDVVLSGADGCILSYTLSQRAHGAAGVLGALFGSPEHHAAERHAAGIRGDADLRIGPDLIVVPDDAVLESAPAAEHGHGHEDAVMEPEWRPRMPRPAEATTGSADPLAREESPTLPAPHGAHVFRQPTT